MRDSRTSKFIKNVLGSAFLQIVTVVTGFISPRLMIDAFGSEINGITASILQFVSYIGLVEAGLNSAAVFALYKPLALKDERKIAEVSSAIRVMYVKTGIYFSILALILAIFFPFISHTAALDKFELSILVLIISSQSAINFFILAKYRTLLSADQLGYFISYSSALQLMVNLSILYVTIRLGWGVVAVRAAALFALVLTSVLLALVIKWKYPRLDFHAEPDLKSLSTRKDALFLQIMGVITNGAPVVFMTVLLDFKQISVYSIYAMIAGSVTSCIAVFTSGLGAAFGDIYALDDQKLLEKTSLEFRTAYYMLITVIYSAMFCTLMPFIKIYTKSFSDTNYYFPAFGFLMTLNGIVFNFRAPHGMFIFSQGKFSLIRRQTIIQALLILAGSSDPRRLLVRDEILRVEWMHDGFVRRQSVHVDRVPLSGAEKSGEDVGMAQCRSDAVVALGLYRAVLSFVVGRLDPRFLGRMDGLCNGHRSGFRFGVHHRFRLV